MIDFFRRGLFADLFTNAGLIALGCFDHAAALFDALPDHGRYEFDISREIAKLSRRYGRRAAATSIKAHLRDLIPHFRSLTVGLPR